MLLTAVPFFVVGATCRLPDTYHSAGSERGTATLKFYEVPTTLGLITLGVKPVVRLR